MEIIKVTGRLTPEERETILVYDSASKQWIMDSTVAKHFNKAVRQNWIPKKQYVYEDGTVCGMVLTAPDRAVTIRNTDKKKMTEKQMGNLTSIDEDDKD